jgi:glutathione S-transferase
MALLQAGQAFEAIEIVLRDKPAALLALSPKATVPVLQLPDGSVLEQSWDIMGWALAQDDADGCWSRAQTDDMLWLLQRNDGEFKQALDRYKYPERFAAEGMTRHTARGQAVVALLQPLEARLRAAPHVGGDTPCATDLAIFPFVRQFAAVDPLWFAAQDLPAVQAWLSAWLNSRLFAAWMVKLVSGRRSLFPPLPD